MFATVVSIGSRCFHTFSSALLLQTFSGGVSETQIVSQGQRSYRHTPSDLTKQLQEKGLSVCLETFVFYFPSCRETDGGDASLQTQKVMPHFCNTHISGGGEVKNVSVRV